MSEETPTERMFKGEILGSVKVKSIGQNDDMISSDRVRPMKEKAEYTSTPDGFVKVIALQDYAGMIDVIFTGEVFMLPERRYKSLQARGFVAPYDGKKKPIDKR